MKCEFFKTDDLEMCAKVFADIFNGAPWNEKWTPATASDRINEILKIQGSYGLKAVDDEKWIGFVVGYIKSQDRKISYIVEMGVIPAWQGQGIGTTLLEKTKEYLVEKGVKRIYISTNKNKLAVDFYRKNGFRVSEPKHISQSESSVEMVYLLK